MVSSLEAFYALTLRQIEEIAKEIFLHKEEDIKVKNDELKLIASMHGAKIKFEHPPEKNSSNISEEDHSKIEELAQKDFKEKQAKWQNREQTN